MQKLMRRISIVSGYALALFSMTLSVLNGKSQSYTLIGIWFKSFTQPDFFSFWQKELPPGVESIAGTGLLLLLVLFSLLDAVSLTAGRSIGLFSKLKNLCLYFTLFGIPYFPFFQSSPGILPLPIIALLEFLLLRYLEGKPERDRAYEKNQAREKEKKRDKQERLSFKGRYPLLFKQIIRKNLLFYRRESVILVTANLLSYAAIALLLFFYRTFSSVHSQESIFDKTGLLRIFIESGGLLALLLLIFLTFINGTYLYFKAHHGELWILLGIRRKTFLWMIVREYLLSVLAAILIGTLLILPVIKLDVLTYLIAIGLQLALAGLTLAFHQEKILRLLQFKPKTKVVADKEIGKGAILWLLIGLLFLAVTYGWFLHRKSAETLLVFLTLVLGLLGLTYGGASLFVRWLRGRTDYFDRFLAFTDLFYQFRKSVNLLMALMLLQLLNLGFLIPRLTTYQMTDAAELFPYEIVAKINEEDSSRVGKIADTYQAEVQSYPMVPITSVDGDPEPEIYGTIRPVMYIQGQHIGISEATYQKLRQQVGLEKRPLHLKKDHWHVVYQQAISIQAQPIDWDPGSKAPRLRIGKPLDTYDTLSIDTIFPMRKIQSQERQILTGMFQRGLQENLIVVPDEVVQETTERLVLIQTDQAPALVKDLDFLNKKYAAERRWDASVLPFYWHVPRKQNVVTENQLEMLVLFFLVVISTLLSLSLLFTKYVSEKNDWISRQNLLQLLGMREKERRKLLNRQLRVFYFVPMVVGGILSLGFLWAMIHLRFFNSTEVFAFTWRLLLIDSFYSAVWYGCYRWSGNQMMKWVKQ